MINKFVGLILSLVILHGCAEPIAPGDIGNELGNNDTNTNVNNAPGGGSSANLPSRLAGEVYYTGYDGGINDLSVLISTRRTLVIDDPSVAAASLESIEIPTTTVDGMIAELKAIEEVSSRREQRLRERLATARAWRITPLKAGTTLIKATRTGSDGSVRPESVWYNAELRTLVVSAYTPEQIQLGETRYLNGAPSCASCHTDLASGAPTHEIGRVTEISDADAISWISRGAAGDRVSVSHAWSFASEAEKAATVAYLRKQQTKDVADLARLLFDEVLTEAKAENL